jgi:hypothetical protein
MSARNLAKEFTFKSRNVAFLSSTKARPRRLDSPTPIGVMLAVHSFPLEGNEVRFSAD